MLVYDGFTGNLTANPVERITNDTGIWTLRLIVATLALSPLRWLTGWNPLIQYRRALGLFAFFYGTLHFLTYFVLDHQLEFEGLWDDVVKRPYITAGFTAFVLMVPLALTSTTGWIRRNPLARSNKTPSASRRSKSAKEKNFSSMSAPYRPART